MTLSKRYQCSSFTNNRIQYKAVIWRKLAIEVREAIGWFDEFDTAYATAPAYRIQCVADGFVDIPDKETQEAIIRFVWKARHLFADLENI